MKELIRELEEKEHKLFMTIVDDNPDMAYLLSDILLGIINQLKKNDNPNL